jgi:hypothetical protein
MSIQEADDTIHQPLLVRLAVSFDQRQGRFRLKVHLNAVAQKKLGTRILITGSVMEGLIIAGDKAGQRLTRINEDGRGYISLSRADQLMGFKVTGRTIAPFPLAAILAPIGPNKVIRTAPMAEEDITKLLIPPKRLLKKQPSQEVNAQKLAQLLSPLVSPDDERKLANAVLNINEAVKKAGLLLTLRDGLLEAALPVKWRRIS